MKLAGLSNASKAELGRRRRERARAMIPVIARDAAAQGLRLTYRDLADAIGEQTTQLPVIVVHEMRQAGTWPYSFPTRRLRRKGEPIEPIRPTPKPKKERNEAPFVAELRRWMKSYRKGRITA